MASNFKHEALKKCVAVICQSIGFQGIYSMPLEVLTDLLHRYLREIAVLTHRFAEHDNRSLPTLSDLSYAFHELKILMPELEEFINSVESCPFPDLLPRLPITRPSELNLLKPGSREILSRPIHIHEHLPPMLPDKEEEDSKDGLPNGICNGGGDSSSEGGRELEPGSGGSSPALSSLKRGGDGVGGSSPKRIRLEGEGSPVREIHSIMMTTSGFISAAREGKLPDSHLPHIPLPVLPHQTPLPRSSAGGGGGGRSGTNSNNTLSAAAISAKKKLSLERLMRHKHNMAIKKAAQNAMSGLAAGSSSFNINKNKVAKKSLSHSAILNMAGVGMDSSMCFTTKHGKSKEKLKPKIPPTPPGTSRVPMPVLNSSESPHTFNKNINIPKRPSPSMSSTPLPPKLKIPTPKLKQPEFSTDVLPLPKEDIQEQQERKLQIIKKEEKQKELARAAKNGLLGPLVACSAADTDDALGARYVSGGVPSHVAAIGGAGGPLAPVELINKIRKEKKEKDGKKEFKKGSKEVKKDKEKRDKEKHDSKKEKILKKKEGKEKREKERKEEKKKDKESKKLKDSSKKDRDLKKNKDKKLKYGKIQKKDHLKKEKKEKKFKKIGPSDGSAVKFSKEAKANASIESTSLKGDTSLISMQPNMPDEGNFLGATADFNTSPSPISPDVVKSKLCVFKKGTKTSKDGPLPSHDTVVDISDSHEQKPSLPGMGHNITNVDISAELSGVLSSPSFIEDPHSNLPIKVGKTKKRKYAEQLDSSLTGTPFSSKVKPKHEKLGLSPKGRNPKGSLDSHNLGSTNDPIDIGDDNATPFNIGMLPGMPINSWDGRPLTPGCQITFSCNKGPLTPGLHCIPPFTQHPHSFLPPNIGMDPFSSPQRSHETLDRPATPGQYFPPSVRTPDQYLRIPSSAPCTPPPLGSYPGSTSASAGLGKLSADFSMASSGGTATLTPDGQRVPVDLDKKKKDKDHRKEKKDKDKIKKKKDKKEKLKLDKKIKDKVKKEKKKKKISNVPVSAAPGVSDQQKPNVHKAGPSDDAFGGVDLQGPFTPPATTKISGASLFSKSGSAMETKEIKLTSGTISSKCVSLSVIAAGNVADLAIVTHASTLLKNTNTSCVNTNTKVRTRKQPCPKQQLLPRTLGGVIKRTEPSNSSSSSNSSFSVSANTTSSTTASLMRASQPGSPELAKISALITRPPKQHPSASKDKEKKSSRGGSSSRELIGVAVSSSTAIPSMTAASSTSIVLLSAPQVHPVSVVKTTDVVSIPSIKIKEVKSSTNNTGMGITLHASDSIEGDLDAPVVPPLKIRSTLEDNPGFSKKSSSTVVFGSSSTHQHRATKPSRQAGSDPGPSHPLPVGAPTSTPSDVTASAGVLADALASIGHFVDDQGNDVWICPTCGKQDDGSPMIGCDTCDDWYHWVCVGIQVPPNEADNWYCPRCLAQHKQRSLITGGLPFKKDKKKHHHRKKKQQQQLV